MNYQYAILLIAGTTASWACLDKPAEAAGSGKAPTTMSATVQQRATNVTKLYNDTCAKCHGEEAQGGGGGTPSLLTVDKYDQKWDKAFFDATKNGVPQMGMEAYGQTMTDQEIWGLVVHIRELQGRGLRRMNGSPKAVNGVYPSKHHGYKIETVIEQGQGLQVPWGLDWLPDGKMLVTNKPGKLLVTQNGKVLSEVTGLPPIMDIGQGGLMDVAVHPDYAKNGWIYLSFADPAKNGKRDAFTKIVRGKLKVTDTSATWYGEQTIFQMPQEFYNGAGVHFGCRIVFDRKGHIFFSLGERGNGNLAQQLDKPNGKIYRVNEDGTIPSDNPFAKGSIPAIWSYGHRNPQGLVMGLDGNLWDTEHGPRGGDEVNHIQKGANYGWPLVAFSINYNDSPMETPWPKPEQNITLPVFRWLPSIGACGLDVMKGNAFPLWKGDLLAGGLSGANVDRIKIVNDKVVEREELVHGMGRVRDVATGPDGFIYIALNDPHKIIRIIPAK